MKTKLRAGVAFMLLFTVAIMHAQGAAKSTSQIKPNERCRMKIKLSSVCVDDQARR